MNACIHVCRSACMQIGVYLTNDVNKSKLTVKALEDSLSKVERALAAVLVSMSLSNGGGFIKTM